MSILIKNGMEMPKSCADCFLEDTYDGYNCRIVEKSANWGLGERPSWCPLSEVPTPHGDLIGREWLIDIALHLMNTAKNDDIANGVKWLLQYIIDAPTIIEAEG